MSSFAYRNKLPPSEILVLKQEYASHIQWMMAQRRKMDQFASMAHHEGFVVENSDKCGDDCLYLPNSSRLASANQSKYKYRLSLQANVYAGKLYHLCLLLPSLITGADFGITSFLAGAHTHTHTHTCTSTAMCMHAHMRTPFVSSLIVPE